MRAFEFRVVPERGKPLVVPSDLASSLPVGRPLRVIVLVDDPEHNEEDVAWDHSAADQFAAGYAEGDAIYDRLGVDEKP